MKYMYIDESGELGFSKNSSRYFILTILLCGLNENQSVGRIFKKIRKNYFNKKSMKELVEIKAGNTQPRIRKKILEKISSHNVEVFSIIVDKYNVYSYLRNEKHKLYNYITSLILGECSLNCYKLNIVIDRSKNKRSLRDDFDSYIRSNIKKKSDCKVEIIHEASHNSGGLQVVDFISWSIFRKYEHNELWYYNLIKSKIIVEKKIWEKADPKV